jgi:hypothetical protein
MANKDSGRLSEKTQMEISEFGYIWIMTFVYKYLNLSKQPKLNERLIDGNLY